ncbi:hypothetical protein [Stenotrophomonas acidaminiphila]|uniref:hypothetical protein n=1 Tax=Stenotrophomonas acidaminiphila TaxID=128780 RepID=UPI0020C69401|nr:hypothetical protein [Stenotrophomonas acidaminiphila]
MNSFYWMYRSASALLLQQSENFTRATDFIPQPEASHLDISCSEIEAISTQADRVARYGILVQVITYYEVYLTGVLSDVVSTRWPGNRQVTIKFRPSDLPNGELSSYLKAASVASEVTSVIDESYSKRLARISNLLTSCGFPEPQQTADRKMLVAAACEIRNCVVHNGGKVDQRTSDALQSIFPTVAIGAQFELDEARLWKLLAAVRDDARAIDFAIRKQASDKRVSRSAKKKRASARRKAENFVQMRARRGTTSTDAV